MLSKGHGGADGRCAAGAKRMLGAIIGDVVGSIYEHRAVANRNFPLLTSASTFTDDTVCTIAVADHLLGGADAAASLRKWGRRYIDAGYGKGFKAWLLKDDAPGYGSSGNGAAMRIAPCAHLCASLDDAMAAARRVTRTTHDHPESLRGAMAVTAAVRLAFEGAAPAAIRSEIARRYAYPLSQTLDQIRVGFGYDISCAGTVPLALTAALEADSFVGAIRNAVALNGDSDTIACIAGAVAEGLFKIPSKLAEAVMAKLPADMQDVLARARAADVLTRRTGVLGRLSQWLRA